MPHTSTNRIERTESGPVLRIFFRDGREKAVVFFDEEDAEKVASLSWTVNKKGYVIAYLKGSGAKNRQNVLLHRFLLDCLPEVESNPYNALKGHRAPALRKLRPQRPSVLRALGRALL